MGTHWIAFMWMAIVWYILVVLGLNIKLKNQTKKFIGNKNIIPNIGSMLDCDLMMFGLDLSILCWLIKD